MRVSRLEIFGFKSFRDRFVLDFDRDVIGIVGPNGCGKSNIVDSLRWVLGETHAKQLRGSVFDDLIFNGSETHRPLGMAEVSITIRPSEDWSLSHATESSSNSHTNGNGNAHEQHPGENTAPNSELSELEKQVMLPEVLSQIPGLLDSSEIQLTRRLYRSGESEYFINRTACRLRDMVEVYRVLGLGARGLSIVQQGEVGEILSKKPVERRELLEEAAGISGFRARMEAAQRKLTQTNENLARLADIILEVDKQVKILRVQSKRAQARNELKESIRVGELGLFAAKSSRLILRKTSLNIQHQQLKTVLEDSEAALRIAQAEDEKFRSQVEIIDAEIVDVRRERDAIAEQVSAQQLKENEFRIESAKVEERLGVLSENLEGLSQRKAVLVDRKSELDSRLSMLRSELNGLSDKLAESSKEIAAVKMLLSPDLDSSALAENVNLDYSLPRLPFTERLSFAEQDANAVRALVAGVHLCNSRKDAEQLMAFFKASGQTENSVVTADGEVLSAYGWLDGEGIGSLLHSKIGIDHGLLERERQLRAAQGALLALQSTKQSELEYAERELAQADTELSNLRLRGAKLNEDLAVLESSKASLAEQLDELKDTDNTEIILQARQLEATYRGLDARLRGLENERSSLKLKLAEVVNDLAQARRSFDSSNQKNMELRLQLERLDVELNLLLEDIQKNYGAVVAYPSEAEISSLVSKNSDLDAHIAEAEESSERLRRRLEREGEVDPDAIVRHQEEELRLEHLTQQQADLQQAVRTLDKTSRELKEISKKRFLDTFSSVSEKFTVLVPQLFGGGGGKLELVDPEDPLTSGVELTVRPPGKNVRTMDLLSGGEKALAATALLMAMFLHRPSPICVLDEVDAPLDDTNLERFLGLIRANVDKAQFLIITHNKLSMAASDRLVGITMQEKGVSTALSVTLAEFEQELEPQVVNL